MKKSTALFLIIFSLLIGAILGSAAERSSIKKSIRVTNVVEDYDAGIGTVTIDWGHRLLDDGHYSDSECQDYNYFLKEN